MGKRCSLRIASVHAVIPVQEDTEIAVLTHDNVHAEGCHGCVACAHESIQLE